MQLQNLKSLGRALMQLGGAYLIGHTFFGHANITTDAWQAITGMVAVIGSTLWGIWDHSATVDTLESAVRSVATTGLGLLTSWGLVNGQNATAIIGAVTALTPFLLSVLSKQKVASIASGALTATSSGKTTNVLIFLLLTCALLSGSFCAHAQYNQGFFGGMQKPVKQQSFGLTLDRAVTTTAVPSVIRQVVFKPVICTSYFEGGNQGQTLLAGVGAQVAFTHYVDSTQLWKTDVAISGFLYGGENLSAPVNPDPNATLQLPSKVLVIGITVGLLNNHLQLGYGYSTTLHQFAPTIGTAIQFLN